MKATVDIPDALYRRVKAKSAMRGQPVREIVVSLFQGWLEAPEEAPAGQPAGTAAGPVPAWFGAARNYARQVKQHNLAAIRRSIRIGRTRLDPSAVTGKRIS